MTVEIRAWIQDCEKTLKKLDNFGFTSKGSYKFKDLIYHPKNGNYDLNREFMRLRLYEKSNWDYLPRGSVTLVHKVKPNPQITGQILQKYDFSHFSEAEDFLYSTHRYAFSASRTGTEYKSDGLRIFVEDIEFLKPSVEVIAETKKQVLSFLHRLGHLGITSDSVPQLIAIAQHKHDQ